MLLLSKRKVEITFDSLLVRVHKPKTIFKYLNKLVYFLEFKNLNFLVIIYERRFNCSNIK
jgi:hypothetical protein